MYAKNKTRLFKVADMLGYKDKQFLTLLRQNNFKEFDESSWEKYFELLSNNPLCQICNGPQRKLRFLEFGQGFKCIEYPGHLVGIAVSQLAVMVEARGKYSEIPDEEKKALIQKKIPLVMGGVCKHDRNIYALDCELCLAELREELQRKIMTPIPLKIQT